MQVYRVITELHSYWAYLVLLILLLATINALVKYITKKPFGAKDMRISLFTLIVTHLQLLIGILLYVTHPGNGLGALTNPELSMGDIMKSSELRLFTIEHPLIMIIVVALVTIGYSKHKKQLTSKGKFAKLALFYTLALIFALSRIPWERWLFQ